MRYSLATFYLMVCIALFAQALPPLAVSHGAGGAGQASAYLTIAQYERRHPEQKALRKAFSAMVSEKGIRAPRAARQKQIRIAVIYPGQQVSDYWRRSIVAFRARMDEIGLNYHIDEFFTKPAVDYRIQEKLIRKSLDQNPDYLVFTLDIKRHQRIIQRIITRSSPKVILQNITTPLKAWEGKQPFLYVGFDHVKGTRKLARYYLEKTKGKGSYALLYFSRGYVSVMRGNSFVESLRHYPDLKQAAAYYTDGNREKSRLAVLDILNTAPDIRFIYACATDVAFGAIDALKQSKGTEQIMVNGWGGGSSELEAIRAGDMDVTVMRINDDNGVAMAEAIRLDLEHRSNEVPQIYSGEFALVEKGINPADLARLKQTAFRYSGQTP
ncbi:MAG TPA: sugar ABC transporter substrate-binding protein [Desulfobacteraceae bacterium]|nr:sugar ABC transporter substrate-binding protein [Desulfobacteraceae bacterium]